MRYKMITAMVVVCFLFGMGISSAQASIMTWPVLEVLSPSYSMNGETPCLIVATLAFSCHTKGC